MKKPDTVKIRHLLYCCKSCGSTEMRRKAEVAWNLHSQEWKVTTVSRANVECIACGSQEDVAVEINGLAMITRLTTWAKAKGVASDLLWIEADALRGVLQAEKDRRDPPARTEDAAS